MPNDKEKNLRIMDIVNDIARHAADSAYVKTRAEDLVADLFCDCIRDGAKAYLCVTGSGPAYTIDTDFGSFTLPFTSVNDKLMNGAGSITGSTRPELMSGSVYDEKKKNIVEEPEAPVQEVDVFNANTMSIADADTPGSIEYDSCETHSQEHILSNDKETARDFNGLGNNSEVLDNTRSEHSANLYENTNADDEASAEEAFLNANPVRDMDETDAEPESGEVQEPASISDQANEVSDIVGERPVKADSIQKDQDLDELGIEESLNDAAKDEPSLILDNDAPRHDTAPVDENVDREYEINDEINDEIANAIAEASAESVSLSEKNDTITEQKGIEPSSITERIDNPEIVDVRSSEEGTGNVEKKVEEPVRGFRSHISIQETQPVRKSGKYGALDQNVTAEPQHVFAYADDRGQIFKHTHHVAVRLKYGNSAKATKYKVEFWPTWVQYASRANTFADCLVRISDEEGHEKIDFIDRTNSEFTYKFPGSEHQFKMVAAWQSGRLNTIVQLVNDSKYATTTTVEREEPEKIDGTFLNQFKWEAKGQPKYFIVPLRPDNRGEERVPIVGIVEDPNGRTKYILSRMANNTCQHTFNNRTRVISGHWENGLFHIFIN